MSNTVGIDFSKLTLCDALDLAMFVEEEAMERYGELADQLEKHRTPHAARFFRYMEKNEAKHREALATKRRALFPSAAVRVHRGMLFDVEALEYDEARIFMSLRQALEASLRAESKARAFFDTALAQVEDAEVRALFGELRDEEVQHQALVQREIDKLPAGAEPNPADYADEPNHQ